MLRKIFIICTTCILLAFSSLSFAEEESLCDAIEEVASVIMIKRQAGLPMSNMIKHLNKISDNDFKEVISEIIVEAYQTPMFYTKEAKARAVLEFKNRWYLQCYKKLN